MDDVKQSVVMTQPQKTRYILSESCVFFGITNEELLKAIGTKNKINKTKRYIAYVLSEYTELPYVSIAELVGYCNKDAVGGAIKKMREELSDDFYSDKKTKMIYNELLSYLNL